MIWFILVIVLIAFLFLPVKVDIAYLLYGGENRFSVRVGFVAPVITVFDTSKRKQHKKREKKTEESEDDKKKSDDKKGKKIDFEYIKRILNLVTDVFAFLKKRLVICLIKLHFHYGADDAAKTGIAVGSAWGFLYDFVSLCDNKFTLKKHSVHVSPDFTREIIEADIRGIISLRLIYVIIILIKLLKGMKEL